VASSRREHNDFDVAADMTPHRDVSLHTNGQTFSAKQDDREAAPAAALDQVELPNKNEPVTDGVIRQLIDQIAQLQRASDARYIRHATVAADRS